MPRLTRQERRGASNIEGRAKPGRALKRPVTCYVHYTGQADERLVFRMECSGHRFDQIRYRSTYPGTPNVCAHYVSLHRDPDARLVVLPSQRECACHIGSTCDIAHDPADCACDQCTGVV